MKRLLTILPLLVFYSTIAWSQQDTDATEVTKFYDAVVRLRDGTVIRDVEVSYEYEEGMYERYVIKTREGTIIRKLPSEILVIESHARTFYPPRYNPITVVTPCDHRWREKQWYFVEARAWGYYAGKDESENAIGIDQFAFGPEAVFGLRFGMWGMGVGASYFRSRDISRVPVFLHGRYQLSAHCFAPFVYAQAGTVFDNQSEVTPSFGEYLSPAPKILGVGAGFDYPLASWLDLSVDLGYRYLQLPTLVDCDCSPQPPATTAVFYNESHGVLLRAGVTF